MIVKTAPAVTTASAIASSVTDELKTPLNSTPTSRRSVQGHRPRHADLRIDRYQAMQE
jgi:hypothetical protein